MNRASKLVSAACGAVMGIYTRMPPLMVALLIAMTIDYMTGLICAARGRSPKTEGGGLSSRAAVDGLLKKVALLFVVGLAVVIDDTVANSAGVSFNAVTGAVCLWFIASEGVSILENAAAMGVPVPEVLTKALEIMKDTGRDSRNSNG